MHATTRQAMFILAALAAGPGSASPLHIGGTFAGVAVGVRPLPLNFPPPHPLSYYEGAPVTGSFEVFVPNAQPVPWRDDGFNNEYGLLSLSFTVHDETFAYSANPPYPSAIEMTPSVDGGPQSVAFRTWWIYRYDGAGLRLDGPEGSLFDGLDPRTLHHDPMQPLTMNADMTSGTGISMDVDIRQFTIHDLNAVPEPSTYALALLGLTLIAVPRVGARSQAQASGRGQRIPWKPVTGRAIAGDRRCRGV